ncbi:SAM-dependent methyltransferase [Bradyrhizobium sp. BRP22]|uniref:SAM-dependent methyltransferase n=1 Tax=Bradyrhizobium sp. BRP22 TaxID=2793821 RepID=UPI001CD6BB28|nr:SAM-dependent methyltransferase [Bradyrhizobium sp. BRP22]MCA1452384.1 SAM-dependent methyltransferase [Bradyrhizobium sp. BRP22]
MAQAAAKTGAGPTVMVAIEQWFPSHRRILTDDLALSILPFGARAFVHAMRPFPIRDWMVRVTERTFPGLWSGIMCRKRFIDDAVVAASPEIDAIVNLGAGFDTRAYRLQSLAAIPVWEVDQPANIRSKQDGIRRRFGGVPPHVTLVPIDFDHEALEPALSSCGYAPTMRTFFIWEAVTQYLSETGIRSTLEFLATAAPGSRLAFTYVQKDFIDGRNLYDQPRLYERYVKQKIWLFGIDPRDVASFLEPYGWRVTAHAGCDDLAERFVKPTGRQLLSSPLERIACAEKM